MKLSKTPEFEKEYKVLHKKYASLPDDIETFEQVLSVYPFGQGTKFNRLSVKGTVTVMKARLVCRTLRDSSLRIIYAYDAETITFLYIELYAKNQKENEDRLRVKTYLDSLGNA